jgi:biopolymer transport protein ExbD
MKISLLIGCAVLLVVAGCKQETQSTSSETPTNQSSGVFPGQSAGSPAPSVSEWAKVKIDATGAVFVNKKQMTADEFRTECARFKKVSAAVVLFVDATNHVVNSAQAGMIRQIVDAGVPMKAALKESELE